MFKLHTILFHTTAALTYIPCWIFLVICTLLRPVLPYKAKHFLFTIGVNLAFLRSSILLRVADRLGKYPT